MPSDIIFSSSLSTEDSASGKQPLQHAHTQTRRSELHDTHILILLFHGSEALNTQPHGHIKPGQHIYQYCEKLHHMTYLRISLIFIMGVELTS